MPKTLYHWSRKSLDVFSHNDPRFEVRTQGHAYALDDIDNKSGATSRFEAKSLIVFTEQAAELFEKHPLPTMMGWKRLFGQYWTKKFLHDLRWNASDAFRCGEVLVIRKGELVPVTLKERIRDQWARRAVVLVMDLLMLLFLADAAVSITTEWGVLNWLSPEMSTTIGIAIMVVGAAVVVTVMCLMRVGKSRNTDGTEWDYRSELECAMKAAEEARIREEKQRERG
ncbi:hypothetical protein [Rhizobium sp. LCM 4573]|uniref:hypothetical protein n=1 Tax=Rhizobium sp. LCM 4573 TaxID=1848291 RepID=UPI0008DA10D8|nr:hypothetical protein [Rhizobium sp. LCM 4573]OHV83669.1 hypothetical protein LCM4573_06065 [Rhizobium sp. LCM 4573]